MYRRPFIGLTLLCLAIASPAFAQITAFWQQVTITPAGIANDSALANMQCWDLMTTTTGNWAAARLFVELPPFVRYYKHALGGFTEPNPALVAQHPALAFTSHVTSPNDNGTNGNTRLLGGFPQSWPMSLGDATSATPGVFSVEWGDFFVDPPGTYYIARLTFPQAVLPAIWNNVPFPQAEFSASKQIDPEAIAEVPEIPEPRYLGLMSVGAAMLGVRSRNRRDGNSR